MFVHLSSVCMQIFVVLYFISLYDCLSFVRVIVWRPSVCLFVCQYNIMFVCKSNVCMHVRDIPYFLLLTSNFLLTTFLLTTF